MSTTRDIVITGMGVISPIGIGTQPFWDSLLQGRSGVRRVDLFVQCGRPAPIGGQVADFDPKKYIRQRKSLKVMSRDIQLGCASADMACADAGWSAPFCPPERAGIVFGSDMIACELDELVGAFRACIAEGKFDYARWGQRAMSELYPLWMLKYLPNMPACHIGIAQDMRGPTNSLVQGEVSSLSAVAEAARVIARGQADAMLAGGASSRVHPMIWAREQARQFSARGDNPAAASRPFDAQRDGMVNGEGAATFFLETRASAEARGARILARVLGFAESFEAVRDDKPMEGRAIRAAIREALARTGLAPEQIGHVNAHGLSTTADDRIEAQAIRDTLGDVPVTAPKSFFGNLGAGSAAVEMAASVLALQHGLAPHTLNYEQADPECPVRVIHGQPMPTDKNVALLLNHARSGQAVALVLGKA